MMLITKQEIIDIAYISSTITVDEILDSAITTALQTYAREAMSESLYNDVLANSDKAEFELLLSDYLKPFLAYAVKSILFYQQIHKGTTSPTTEDQLVYEEIYILAKSKYNILQSFCASSNFSSYIKPQYVTKAGFLIKT
jgi:hypothetical protein